MAPSKPKDQSDSILAELAAISNKLSKLDPVPEKLEAMEILLAKLSEENISLKREIRLRDEEISGLHHRLNSVEQYNRSWSIRINNVPIPPEDESNPKKVMEAVYTKLVHPILTGAHQKGAIESIPSLRETIETAHILPGKPNSPKPIIARFTSRHIKQTLFAFKKHFSPKIFSPLPLHALCFARTENAVSFLRGPHEGQFPQEEGAGRRPAGYRLLVRWRPAPLPPHHQP
jgi:hypothetical protein